MEEEYKKALEKIKKLNRIVSKKEWNEIAKRENLITARTIEYIAQKSLRQICLEINIDK